MTKNKGEIIESIRNINNSIFTKNLPVLEQHPSRMQNYCTTVNCIKVDTINVEFQIQRDLNGVACHFMTSFLTHKIT